MTEKKYSNKLSKVKTLISPAFHIEADGSMGMLSILISGTVGIAEFSSEEVKLITKNESIRISGKHINLSVFEQKVVEITGKIENISFSSKSKKGGKK